MIRSFFHLGALALALLATVPAAFAKSHDGDFSWNNAVIHIEVSGKAYSYVQPWVRAERKAIKTGVVVQDHLIITTADGLNDQTVIKLQKNGGGFFSSGTLVWIDYQSNLAALTTDEKSFWEGLQPATLADPMPATGSVRILRWLDDRLENRPGDIERVTVDNNALSFVSVPALKVDSTVTSATNGEAVTMGDKLLGLASGQDSDVVTAVPSSFIDATLKARKNNTFTGLGYFDFTWEQVQNPLNLQYLGVPAPPRGVVVKDTGLKPGVESLIHTRDVILSIDGFDIDSQGDYEDPQYGKMMLENLSSRGKWAGQTCQIKVWRDGREQTITYKLPRAEFSDELVPEQSFDQSPDYVMAGGLVFVRLSDALLRSWGANWRQRAPFRLAYFETEKVRPDRTERVVLSGVLPAKLNVGYEMLHDCVIDEVNGKKIGKIADLPEALKSPINGFDVFKFAPGEPMETIVLDATEVDSANQEIMAHYHIPADHLINPPVSTAGTTPATATTTAVVR